MLVKDKIIVERKKRGLTAHQLADEIGVTPATVSRYESGNIKIIPLDTLKNITNVLKCDFNTFVQDDPKYNGLLDGEISFDGFDPDEDKKLILWFRSLPTPLQDYIKSLW